MIKIRGYIFVGTKVQFIDDSRVNIFIKGHLEETITAFGDNTEKYVIASVKRDLFEIYTNSKDLGENKYERFQHIVQKLLFV